MINALGLVANRLPLIKRIYTESTTQSDPTLNSSDFILELDKSSAVNSEISLDSVLHSLATPRMASQASMISRNQELVASMRYPSHGLPSIIDTYLHVYPKDFDLISEVSLDEDIVTSQNNFDANQGPHIPLYHLGGATYDNSIGSSSNTRPTLNSVAATTGSTTASENLAKNTPPHSPKILNRLFQGLLPNMRGTSR